ncbi:unnamed protein product, partial [Phaeothamnion confervicola]
RRAKCEGGASESRPPSAMCPLAGPALAKPATPTSKAARATVRAPITAPVAKAGAAVPAMVASMAAAAAVGGSGSGLADVLTKSAETRCFRCSTVFMAGHNVDAVSRHLAECRRIHDRQHAEAEEVGADAAEAAATIAEAGAEDAEASLAAAAATTAAASGAASEPRRRSISRFTANRLVAAMAGEDVASVAANFAELVECKGLAPPAWLTEQLLQQLTESRCPSRIEAVRRMLVSARRQWLGHWQPLNWGWFEGVVSSVAGDSGGAVHANVIALEAMNDLLADYHVRALGGPASEDEKGLPLVFQTAPSVRAAMRTIVARVVSTWQHFGGATDGSDTRRCAVASRLLLLTGEIYGDLSSDGGKGSGGAELDFVVQLREQIGIQLGGVAGSPGRQVALLHSVAGAKFAPRLAKLLHESMPAAGARSDRREDVEDRRLRRLLLRVGAGGSAWALCG